MSTNEMKETLSSMEPERAAAAISDVMRGLWPVLGETARLKFIKDVVGDAGQDQVASLVHLWLAECMDEGVDPTQMCQTLVNKVTQSRQLMAVTAPEVLVLFENWLEELESLVISHVKKSRSRDPIDVAENVGLSRSGAKFMITKLRSEGKL